MATAKVNLNDYIYFKLSDKGRSILKAYYDLIPVVYRYNVDLNPTKMQLWEFMQIFGKHFQMGFNNPLEEMTVEMDIYEQTATN